MSSSEPAKADGRRFLAWLLGTAALLAAAVLAVAWLVDPYGLLSARSGGGAGLCAPGIRVDDDRYLKPVLIRLRQPEEVVVGSSRALWAFHEESFSRRTGRRTVNLALSAATLEEIDLLVRQAVYEAPVRRVWIGLDFGAFAMPEREPGTLTPLWSVADPDSTALRYGLLDPHALRAGLLALADPESCRDPPFSVHGFARSATPYGHARPALPVLPDARIRAALVQRWRFEDQARAEAYAQRLHRFDALLAFLQERGVQAILFITPSHQTYFSMVGEAGLTGLYRRWRGEVQALAGRNGATLVMSDDPAFLAPLRAPGCPASAPPSECLFYDSTHVRPVVGDAIVAAGLNAAGPQP